MDARVGIEHGSSSAVPRRRRRGRRLRPTRRPLRCRARTGNGPGDRRPGGPAGAGRGLRDGRADGQCWRRFSGRGRGRDRSLRTLRRGLPRPCTGCRSACGDWGGASLERRRVRRRARAARRVRHDAARGAAEMRRVARPGGAVSACIWDFEGGMPLLRAVLGFRPRRRRGARPFVRGRQARPVSPHAAEGLWCTTGFEGVELGQVGDAGADYADFDDLWYPFANGVGNLGRFHEALDEAGRRRFKHGAAERLGAPSGHFRLTARAWYARGTVPAG